MSRSIQKITASMVDGTSHVFETSTYCCTADRVAFERRFGVSSAELRSIGAAVVEVASADDPTALNGQIETARGLKEEWSAFFVWRCAAREVKGLASVSFDEFVDQVSDITIEGADAVDPTREVGQPA